MTESLDDVLKEQAKERIAFLVSEISRLDELYYGKDISEIKDQDYDKLLKELKRLEKKYPELILPNSPTQKVGQAKIVRTSGKHLVPMLSLDNVYSIGELRDYFYSSRRKLKEEKDLAWWCDAKIDGIAINLRYEKGKLVQALTRGDAFEGEDVTANAFMIEDIPKALKGNVFPFLDIFEVRGEVYMKKSVMESANLSMIEKGLKPFSNLRNAASGSLRQLDPEITKARNLNFYAYGYGYFPEESLPDNYINLHERFTQWGIPVVLGTLVTSLKEAEDYYRSMERNRELLDYDIDGVVYKLFELHKREALGRTARHVKWGIAFKFAACEAKTSVEKLLYQVGRTGNITPVVLVKPVTVGGVVVTKFTLHNMANALNKCVFPGREIIVERTADVSPQLKEVINNGNACVYRTLTHCPSCGKELQWDENKVHLVCINHTACPDQIKEKIRYFASKEATDIEGLGKVTVARLVDQGLVKTFSDLYKLNVVNLRLIGLGVKDSQKLIEKIEASKRQPFYRLLTGLGIQEVGKNKAKELESTFQSLDDLLKADYKTILDCKELGEKGTSYFWTYLQDPDNLKELEMLKIALM